MDNFLDFTEASLNRVLDNQEKILKGIDTLMDVDFSGSDLTPKELVFKEDKLSLYHYKPMVDNPNKTPTLIVYALVNRQYMMDLDADKSLIKKLLEGGEDIYIIDWGYPTKEDMYLTLSDYINCYIDDCVNFILDENKIDKINLMGICQGGTFSMIYTATHQDKIKNLVTLVTPVDFDAEDGLLFKWGPYLNPEKMVEAFGNVPGEIMNAGFVFLKPFDLMIDKYVGVVDLLDNPSKLAGFLRMEQWIFDSPDQVGAAYKEFQQEMYHENKLIKGEFKLDGEIVNLKNITCPVLSILGTKDNQVPNSATLPIPSAVGSSDVEELRVETGHIGIFVSGKSQREVGPKIVEFLNNRQ